MRQKYDWRANEGSNGFNDSTELSQRNANGLGRIYVDQEIAPDLPG